MKREQKKPYDSTRRDFLRSSAAAGLGAATVAIVPTAVAAPDETESGVAEQKGYRLTRHILEYYQSTTS